MEVAFGLSVGDGWNFSGHGEQRKSLCLGEGGWCSARGGGGDFVVSRA